MLGNNSNSIHRRVKLNQRRKESWGNWTRKRNVILKWKIKKLNWVTTLWIENEWCNYRLARRFVSSLDRRQLIKPFIYSLMPRIIEEFGWWPPDQLLQRRQRLPLTLLWPQIIQPASLEKMICFPLFLTGDWWFHGELPFWDSLINWHRSKSAMRIYWHKHHLR